MSTGRRERRPAGHAKGGAVAPATASSDPDGSAARWLDMLLDRLRIELEPTVRKHLLLGQAPTDRPLDELVRMMAAPVPRPSPWNDSIGPFYDSTGARHLLGVTRQALAQQRSRRTILAVETPDRHQLYPTFQFDERRRILPGLADVLAAVPADAIDGWTLASWLNRSRLPELDGRTVIAHLRHGGDPVPAVLAARRAGTRWAA